MAPRKFPAPSDPMVALSNWPLWLGLALYGAAFLLYAAVLARLPLNVTHPVLTLGCGDCCTVFGVDFPRTIPLDNRGQDRIGNRWRSADYCPRSLIVKRRE
jgi:hypothetical protein